MHRSEVGWGSRSSSTLSARMPSASQRSQIRAGLPQLLLRATVGGGSSRLGWRSLDALTPLQEGERPALFLHQLGGPGRRHRAGSQEATRAAVSLPAGHSRRLSAAADPAQLVCCCRLLGRRRAGLLRRWLGRARWCTARAPGGVSASGSRSGRGIRVILVLAADRHLEVPDSAPQRPSHFREPLGSEHHQRDHQHEEQVRGLKDVADHLTELSSASVTGARPPGGQALSRDGRVPGSHRHRGPARTQPERTGSRSRTGWRRRTRSGPFRVRG